MQSFLTTIYYSLWNSQERRLRAFWRLLIQTVLWVLAVVLLRVLAAPILVSISVILPTLDEVAGQALTFGLQLVGVLVSVWLATRFVDRRAISELGLQFDRAWWFDLLFGLALGAILMTIIFTVEISVGWLDVREYFSVTAGEDIPFAIAILSPVIVFLSVGITEEVWTRGYQLRNMSEGFNIGGRFPVAALLLSWVLSSAFFGLLHAGNPNATWISTLYLMLAGLFLGLGLILTGRLGLPIGLHISWNFFQGNVFGFPVSGNDFSSATVIAIDQAGPTLWTGGAFGPEAGLIGIGAILLGCVLTVLWVRLRYGHVALYTPFTVYVPRRSLEVDAYQTDVNRP